MTPMTPMTQEILEMARAGDLAARDRIVEGHMALIEAEARRFAGRRAGVEVEDLITPAFIGLTDAIRTFDADRGVAFHAHARRRVRGAILDQARAQSRLARSSVVALREVEERREELRQDLGREPAPVEVEEASGGAELVLRAEEAAAAISAPVSAEEAAVASSQAEAAELAEVLEQTLWCMDARERQMARLYYLHGVSQEAIARSFGLSPSRVFQLMERAKSRGRAGRRRGSPPSAPRPRARPNSFDRLASRKAAAARGLWPGGHLPFGYRNLERRLFVCEPEGRIVRLMFEQTIAGMSERRLADWLNERGHRTRYAPWRYASVHTVLTNEIYDGWVHFGGVRARGVHEPVLAPGVFARSRAIAESRRCNRRRGTR